MDYASTPTPGTPQLPFGHAPRLLVLLALGSLGLVTAVDAVTPYEFGVSAFYVLPVLFASWGLGWRRGLGFALLSAAIGYAVDLSSGQPYATEFYRVWEAFNHFLAYGLVAFVTGRLRQSFMHERALREELDRTVKELKALEALLPAGRPPGGPVSG